MDFKQERTIMFPRPLISVVIWYNEVEFRQTATERFEQAIKWQILKR